MQIIPTLSPNVYKYDLHWAIWMLAVLRLIGFIGFAEPKVQDPVLWA